MLEDPYSFDETRDVGHFYDYVFTMDDSGVIERKKLGYYNVNPLYLWANPNIYKPMEKNEEYYSDILFIGAGFH